jgi:hypothetical protein
MKIETMTPSHSQKQYAISDFVGDGGSEALTAAGIVHALNRVGTGNPE